jgi:hypothetical protein
VTAALDADGSRVACGKCQVTFVDFYILSPEIRVNPDLAIVEWARASKTFRLLCQDNGTIDVYEKKVNGYRVIKATTAYRAGGGYEESINWYTFANGTYRKTKKPSQVGKIIKSLSFD